MEIRQHKQDWEELGTLNPLWSILTYREKWDIEEFFLTGEREIQTVMKCVMRLGYPKTQETVLDFGCGVGRLTRALSKNFPQCYGVDISESMIAKAKELNQLVTKCMFVLNDEPHLHIFSDSSFDMIYTNMVLQHIPDPRIILDYIAEFIRLLKPDGLLVFQLPTYIPFYRQLMIQKKLYRLLHEAGINEQFLYRKLRLNPMHMTYIPEKDIVAYLNAHGARVLEVLGDNSVSPPLRSCTYYVTKEDEG
jgi:ubiquinone/menaquinone biosynthesis C-methylase UbiE